MSPEVWCRYTGDSTPTPATTATLATGDLLKPLSSTAGFGAVTKSVDSSTGYKVRNLTSVCKTLPLHLLFLPPTFLTLFLLIASLLSLPLLFYPLLLLLLPFLSPVCCTYIRTQAGIRLVKPYFWKWSIGHLHLHTASPPLFLQDDWV